MKSILEEMWYGNVCPNSGYRKATKEATALLGYITDHHNDLQATLTDHQKEIFEKFNDCYSELTNINEREIFMYAFQLGAMIAVEIMSFDVE